jgi:hypothetical protein
MPEKWAVEVWMAMRFEKLMSGSPGARSTTLNGDRFVAKTRLGRKIDRSACVGLPCCLHGT